jgi:hypothetical protein
MRLAVETQYDRSCSRNFTHGLASVLALLAPSALRMHTLAQAPLLDPALPSSAVAVDTVLAEMHMVYKLRCEVVRNAEALHDGHV